MNGHSQAYILTVRIPGMMDFIMSTRWSETLEIRYRRLAHTLAIAPYYNKRRIIKATPNRGHHPIKYTIRNATLLISSRPWINMKMLLTECSKRCTSLAMRLSRFPLVIFDTSAWFREITCNKNSAIPFSNYNFYISIVRFWLTATRSHAGNVHHTLRVIDVYDRG